MIVQRGLRNLGGNEMNVTERLEQVENDIKALQVEKDKLLKQKEKEKRYVFQAGDVAVNECGETRIIMDVNTVLMSFTVRGFLLLKGQNQFENYGYKKIGTLEELFEGEI